MSILSPSRRSAIPRTNGTSSRSAPLSRAQTSRSPSSRRPRNRIPARCSSSRREGLAHVPAGTGRQRPGTRRLLPAHRARSIADLQRRRHRQSGAWRVLRARRLCVGRDHQVSRLCAGRRHFACRRRPARRSVRALHPAAVLHGRSDPQPAGDLRPRDDRGASDPHRLGRPAAVAGDAAKLEGRGHPRRLPVLALSAPPARRGGARAARCMAAAAQDVVRPRRAGRHPAARHGRGARHSPPALHDRDRGARRRDGGGRRRALCPDRAGASGDGRRDHHRRLRRGGDRRAWKLLGRGARGAPGRCRARRDDPFRTGRRRSLDLYPHVPRAVVAPARVAGRVHREIRMRLPAYPKYRPLWVAALALIALPLAMRLLGLSMNTASMVVILAIAAMGLNLLVGYTGLTSFGHATWFGVGAYAAGLIQKTWFHDQIAIPILLSMIFVAALSALVGVVILRRRGVYFSLLTLALSALAYTIAFRWTDVTGGEDGLGGLTRGGIGALRLDDGRVFYVTVAAIGFGVLYGLLRITRSPFGHVLVAIRENQLRATFQGYPIERYKLAVFVISAAVTGLAGTLLGFQTYLVSAEAVSVPFSGELLAMVVIGGMHHILGPALGALFFILFR